MRGFARVLATATIVSTVAGTAGAQPAADISQAAPNTDVAKKGGTLSDKLSTTNGVIHPEGDVDPGIHKPAPATGSMPVIPPAGSPGGPGDVQPK